MRYFLSSLFLFCGLLTSHLISDLGHVERILDQLSEAILSAIIGTHLQRRLLPYVLRDLIKLEEHPLYLTGLAYDWCSAIFENRASLWGWEDLLLTSLEVGFRHCDVRDRRTPVVLTHTKHHLEMVDTIFKSQKTEAIADLLYAWIAGGSREAPTHALLDLCTEHIMGLHDLIPSSPRLRSLVIRSVELMGFERVGVQRFIQMLDHLRVTTEDTDWKSLWLRRLLEILQISEGIQLLPHYYWELLVEVAVSETPLSGREIAYDPRITTFLTESQEWGKLECWVGTIWMVWPPGTSGITQKGLDRWMLLLFRQRPDAAQKLEQWMERWCQKRDREVFGSPQRDYKQAQEAIRRVAS